MKARISCRGIGVKIMIVDYVATRGELHMQTSDNCNLDMG